jgi:TonB-linked SusC/RagA family outer membrane protein
MKKTTRILAMAMPCPYLKVKRPMSQRRRKINHTTTFLLLLFFTLSTANPLLAQNISHQLKGTVTDAQNQPLTGARVTQGTNQTQTDSRGSFTLTLPTSTGSITVTYLGYQSQTLDYNTAWPLNIQLTEDPQTLQAVEINTGYYSVKQKQLTGSISTVKAEQIEKQSVTNPLEALQGRVTGAYIQTQGGTPGANITLEVRGRNSIEASSSPLYLVDGVPFSSQALTNSLSASIGIYGANGASPLNTLSPSDIASIDILKDADATAIYGSRGANGVVLITTKKGKSGKTKIDLNLQSGVSSVTRKIDMLSTQDYLELRKTAFALDGLTPKTTDYDLNGTWNQSRYTNWQNELLGGTANFTTTSSSISGGTAQNSFLASGAYQKQTTVTSGDLGYQRANVHLAASHSSLDQKFSASFSASYSADHTDWINETLMTAALSLAPNAPALYDVSGNLNWENATWNNPLRSLEKKYLQTNNNLLASSILSYKPLAGLELKATLGYNSWQLSDRSTNPVSYYNPAEGRTPATSFADQNQSSLSSWTIEPQASYTRDTKIGTFSLLSGLSFQHQRKQQTLLRGTGFSSDVLIENIKAASAVLVRDYSNIQYAYTGVYARANYTLEDRYILNLTARRDGSSRFGPGNKFANFGAIAGAYVFSEEKLIRDNLPFVSFGKLRISYGTSGNDQIGDYEYLNTYQSTTGYNGVAGLSPVRLYNPDFGWELNRKLEFGLDMNLFNDRIRTTIGHYSNRSSNQLIDYPLAATTGFNSIRNNLAATVQNTGWEVELSSTNIKRKNFSWESSFNLTLPKNRLIAFPGLETSSYANTYAIGHPLNIIKAYHLLGVDPQTGVYGYQDFDNDGALSIAGDRKIILERGQKFYGGLDNSFAYGKLSLSFLFQFVKQTAYTFRAVYTNAPGLASNQPQAFFGRYWQQPGDNAEFQRPTSGGNTPALLANLNYSASDAAIGDASFIRLKNVSLSYASEKIIRGKPLRFFVQGQNLWTITSYFGLDPESANVSLPPLATFTLGFQLTL